MESLMDKKNCGTIFVCLAAALLCAAVCVAGTGPADGQAGKAAPASTSAIAMISPASASTCHGTVKFQQDGANVKVTADLEGVPPGVHGFHIHEFGDCSAPDATSAGSHYDAAGTMHHGKPEDMMKHSGDLGNLTADADGKAHYEITVSGLSISGGSAPILGRGVIVHAKADDFGQPVGNAGGRIGCGVIGVMKPAPVK
jgi:Cu-Zn family superoxide dismutase